MENGLVSELDTQLQHFQSVLQYLDRSGNLNLVKAQCNKYKKCKALVFTFKLLVDPVDLLEANAALGNLLLTQPIDAATVFQEVVYKAINVLHLLPCELALSQVAIILRLSSIPIFNNVNVIDSVRCLSRVYTAGGFCHLSGVVTGVSAISKYTQSTRYYCPEEDCEGYTSKHFIRVHTPGASEAQTIRNDFTCCFCFTILVEEKSSRTLSDRLVAEVIPQQLLANLFTGTVRSRCQAVPVYVRDDLTKVVETGESYNIIGTVRQDIQDEKIMLTIEANNIRKIKSEASCDKLLKYIPRNVLKLYKDRKGSPWSFVLTLAYLFGGEVCPPGSYFKLKLAILLSLMSQLDKQCKPLHVLAIGKDVETQSRLLQFGQRCASKVAILNAGQSLTGRVTKDKYQSADYFVEGGALHLSRGGVCYVGDVNRLKKSVREQLLSVVSGGKITTDVPSKYTGGLPQQIEQPLHSRVWGYSDPTVTKKPHNGEDLFLACDTGDTPKAMLEAFSLLCFNDGGESGTSEETALDMAHQTLQSAMDCTEDDSQSSLPLTTHDFQQFLQFAGKLKPCMTKRAERLISGYYLACRKSRQSETTSVPVTANQTMLSLAYSHAKLALRSEVTLDDALMAIRLYEEALTARFGFSVLSVQPIPHVTSSLLNHCLGPANDKQMQQFQQNLLKYCALASGLEE